MHEENESTQKSPKKWVMCGVHTEERRETAATSPLVWCSDKANAACISLFHVSSVGSIFCDMTMKAETPWTDGLVPRARGEKINREIFNLFGFSCHRSSSQLISLSRRISGRFKCFVCSVHEKNNKRGLSVMSPSALAAHWKALWWMEMNEKRFLIDDTSLRFPALRLDRAHHRAYGEREEIWIS